MNWLLNPCQLVAIAFVQLQSNQDMPKQSVCLVKKSITG